MDAERDDRDTRLASRRAAVAKHQVGDRGQYADSPFAMPLRAWRDVTWRVKAQIAADNLGLISAGVAFYGFLALFPAISVFAIIFGMVVGPSQVTEFMEGVRGVLPAEVFDLIADQLRSVAAEDAGSLSFGLVISVGLSFWSTTKGTKAMLSALNIAYEEREQRGIVSQQLTAVAFALAGLAFLVVSLLLIAAIPAVVAIVALGDVLETVLLLARWPIMFAMLIIGFAVLFRYGPHRRSARIQWLTPGALLSTIVVVGGSIGFSIYVENFGDYNESFGSLGAVVVLLLWLYLSAFASGLGAELNSELERQTRRDSTVGPNRPMGERRAYVADNTVHDD